MLALYILLSVLILFGALVLWFFYYSQSTHSVCIFSHPHPHLNRPFNSTWNSITPPPSGERVHFLQKMLLLFFFLTYQSCRWTLTSGTVQPLPITVGFSMQTLKDSVLPAIRSTYAIRWQPADRLKRIKVILCHHDTLTPRTNTENQAVPWWWQSPPLWANFPS